MKTPLEVLLRHHRQANPKLDEIRRNVLLTLEARKGKVQRSGPAAAFGFGILSRRVWNELFWPCRFAWTAMLGVWVVVLAVNMEMRDTTGSPASAPPAMARVMARALEEQQRLLTELVEPREAAPVPAPRREPRQRSERAVSFKAC